MGKLTEWLMDIAVRGLNSQMERDWKFIEGDVLPWCRYYHPANTACMRSDLVDMQATEEAGYIVMVPVRQGLCKNTARNSQRRCMISAPGPGSGEEVALVDATTPWSEGGQRLPPGWLLDPDDDRGYTSCKTSNWRPPRPFKAG